jgi:excisionase family DNA binding protein
MFDPIPAGTVRGHTPRWENTVQDKETALRQTLTVEETSRRLGLSKNAAYDAARRGDIPTIRIGRRILVPRVALERLINGNAA